jgi:outer membrane lipoprotein-sorting protein
MKFLKMSLFTLALLAALPALSACEQEGPVEENLEEMGDQIEDATDN